MVWVLALIILYMLESYNNTTFSEQSIEVPTPHQRRISMPYKVTTFRVALCIFQTIISDKERKFIFHSYKYRHGSNFFSLPIAMCQPLLVTILISPSQKYQTNPRTDYKYIIIIINMSSIFILLVYELILIYIQFMNYNKGELRCLKYQNK